MSNFDYYEYRINSVKDTIDKELAFYQTCKYATVYPVRDYITYLQNRVGMNRPDNSIVISRDNMGNEKEFQKMNLDDYAKDMDIYVFNKPWAKLRVFHKIMKIKEYVDNLKYDKKAKEANILINRRYLKKELCDGLSTKKFCKNKSEIDYDSEKMIINHISSVEYNTKTKLYEIDWDL